MSGKINRIIRHIDSPSFDGINHTLCQKWLDLDCFALSGLGGDELLEDMRYLIFIQSIYQWFHLRKFPINKSTLGYHQILSEAQTEDRRSEAYGC